MQVTVWDRIAKELEARRKNWQWLADRLGFTLQRVQNWKTRGVPHAAHQPIAEVLGVSIDWLTGTSDVKRPASPGPVLLVAESGRQYSYSDPLWPFPGVDAEKCRSLGVEDRLRLEGALLLAASQLDIDIRKQAAA